MATRNIQHPEFMSTIYAKGLLLCVLIHIAKLPLSEPMQCGLTFMHLNFCDEKCRGFK